MKIDSFKCITFLKLQSFGSVCASWFGLSSPIYRKAREQKTHGVFDSFPNQIDSESNPFLPAKYRTETSQLFRFVPESDYRVLTFLRNHTEKKNTTRHNIKQTNNKPQPLNSSTGFIYSIVQILYIKLNLLYILYKI